MQTRARMHAHRHTYKDIDTLPHRLNEINVYKLLEAHWNKAGPGWQCISLFAASITGMRPLGSPWIFCTQPFTNFLFERNRAL